MVHKMILKSHMVACGLSLTIMGKVIGWSWWGSWVQVSQSPLLLGILGWYLCILLLDVSYCWIFIFFCYCTSDDDIIGPSLDIGRHTSCTSSHITITSPHTIYLITLCFSLHFLSHLTYSILCCRSHLMHLILPETLVKFKLLFNSQPSPLRQEIHTG